MAYQIHPLKERPEALYAIIETAKRVDITLEMVMQAGEELGEVDEFLRLWAAYLGPRTSASAQRLLKEAVELLNDPAQLLENARTFHEQHPALYEQYLSENPGKLEAAELFAIGQEALEVIGTNYVIRSRIALQLSQMALQMGNGAEEQCWLEAFRSDTTVVNYLRLLMECKDFSRIQKEAAKIYHGKYLQIEEDRFGYSPEGELKVNNINADTLYMLAFLGGEFSYVKEHVMSTGDALGWSGTFMKCGLASFLLLLSESKELLKGCGEMCSRIVAAVGFQKEEYQNGTLRTINESSRDWFWKCFCHWKSTLHLSEEEKEGYLAWIEMLIERRVRGIMEANRRKHYGECAGFIAALGEVRESRGELCGKQNVMMEYKAMYSRRSAFHGELAAYGMKGSRKK